MFAQAAIAGSPAAGAAAARQPVVLDCGGGRPPLSILPGSGQTCCITASSEGACARLAREALQFDAAELLPRAGGLLTNLSALENVLLPAVYHGRASSEGLADLVYGKFEACGLSRDEVDALSGRASADLDAYERRLVALVRSLLMRPSLLVVERLFEGLTTRDMERVGRFGDYYRRVVAGGTVMYIHLAGMPCPELAADVYAEAE